MRSASRLGSLPVLLVALAIGLSPPPARAGEEQGAAAPAQRSDPCGFYRGQAYGRGLAHFATEMLWACEAIEARRASQMELSERMLAAEAALERYRAAVVAAGAAAFARERAARRGSLRLGAGDAAKAALAESTGTLAALDAIRAGF